LLRRVEGGLWLAMVALLPVTSMPLVVRLVHSDAVGSPSILLLAALMVIWFVPFLWKRGKLPRQSLPLLAFALVAVAATALANFKMIPPYKDISILRNSVSSFATLVIGICFYIAASVYPASEDKMQRTLRWLNWSGLIVVLWSLAQTAAWYSAGRYPEWMRTIHSWYSIGTFFRQRTTGFALEPSWLAHQLNLLFLPFWLAAVVRRQSVNKIRLFGIFIFEDLLLVLGAAVLWLTLSRVGLIAFLLMIAYLLVRANVWLNGRMQIWVVQRWQKEDDHAKGRQRGISWGITLTMLAVYAGLFLGAGFFLSKVDPRMADLFHFSLSKDNPLLAYANSLNFSSRLVYWEGGWNIFNDHPFLGVGLGNAGYFFPEKLSGYAMWLVEVRHLLFRSPIMLNVKSLWVRLLTETGIVGFSCFAAWFYLLWQTGRALEQESRSQWKTIALAGQFLVIGFIIEGFSVDSFAMPYIWFSAGLVTSAYYSLDAEVVSAPLEGVKVG
jgi:O-antigen ligase